MRDQLQAVADEFESARVRPNALARAVSDDAWASRPDPARWSVSECVAHLNLTSRAFLALMRDGIAQARRWPAEQALLALRGLLQQR